jgi:hypothetical protein
VLEAFRGVEPPPGTLQVTVRFALFSRANPRGSAECCAGSAGSLALNQFAPKLHASNTTTSVHRSILFGDAGC